MKQNARFIAALLLAATALAGCESHLDKNYSLSDPHHRIAMVDIAHGRVVEADQLWSSRPMWMERAKERGDQLVKLTGVNDVFENVTTGTVTTIRHRPSGLRCVDPRVLLTPKTQPSSFDPERPTGCVSGTTGVQSVLMVVPNGDSLTAAQALAGLIQREKQLQPALETRDGPEAPAQSQPSSAFATASLASATGASSRYVHFVVATKNGWVVFAQTSGTPDQAALCDRVAESELTRVLADIHPAGR